MGAKWRLGRHGKTSWGGGVGMLDLCGICLVYSVYSGQVKYRAGIALGTHTEAAWSKSGKSWNFPQLGTRPMILEPMRFGFAHAILIWLSRVHGTVATFDFNIPHHSTIYEICV